LGNRGRKTMKKYDGYEKTEAFTGEYETLVPGGYICKILQVKAEDKNYGTLLRIGFDIIEGEHKDFYKRLFERKKLENSDAKWQGMYYQTIKESDLKYFKGFIAAIEASNNSYKWNWDEASLKGKLFGGVFGQEEFLGNDGEVKLSTKCRWVRSVEQVKKGIQIPEIKKLNESFQSGFTPIADGDNEDDLPF
jgi:hypothetical protein